MFRIRGGPRTTCSCSRSALQPRCAAAAKTLIGSRQVRSEPVAAPQRPGREGVGGGPGRAFPWSGGGPAGIPLESRMGPERLRHRRADPVAGTVRRYRLHFKGPPAPWLSPAGSSSRASAGRPRCSSTGTSARQERGSLHALHVRGARAAAWSRQPPGRGGGQPQGPAPARGAGGTGGPRPVHLIPPGAPTSATWGRCRGQRRGPATGCRAKLLMDGVLQRTGVELAPNSPGRGCARPRPGEGAVPPAAPAASAAAFGCRWSVRPRAVEARSPSCTSRDRCATAARSSRSDAAPSACAR